MNLQQRWRQIQKAAVARGYFESLTAIHVLGKKSLARTIAKTPKGILLDIGCGEAPFRQAYTDAGIRYVGLDLDPALPRIDICGDGQRLPFRDRSVDAVLSGGMLEHVLEPDASLRETLRVLRPGGLLYIGVPHMFPEHREPEDYYRWTSFGLAYVLKKAGFEVVETTPFAGPVAFVSTLISAGLLSLLAPPRWAGPFLAVNALFARLGAWLDSCVPAKAFAVHFASIARRPPDPPASEGGPILPPPDPKDRLRR